MKMEDIKLTDDTVKNLQIMSPHLTEREQYLVMGMCLAEKFNCCNCKKDKPEKTG